MAISPASLVDVMVVVVVDDDDDDDDDSVAGASALDSVSVSVVVPTMVGDSTVFICVDDDDVDDDFEDPAGDILPSGEVPNCNKPVLVANPPRICTATKPITVKTANVVHAAYLPVDGLLLLLLACCLSFLSTSSKPVLSEGADMMEFNGEDELNTKDDLGLNMFSVY